jgi:hypothetical protein
MASEPVSLADLEEFVTGHARAVRHMASTLKLTVDDAFARYRYLMQNEARNRFGVREDLSTHVRTRLGIAS